LVHPTLAAGFPHSSLCRLLQGFENARRTHAGADAYGDHAALLLALAQAMDERGRDTATRGLLPWTMWRMHSAYWSRSQPPNV